MKFRIAIITALVLLAFLIYYITRPLGAKVKIGETIFTVDVAITEPQKQKGLGEREALAETHGMLFVYDHKEEYNFWMRGMRFPLDFVWIDGNVVADITVYVPAPKNQNEKPAIVKPSVPVDKILELNAGTVAQYGIEVGDTVEFIDK